MKNSLRRLMVAALACATAAMIAAAARPALAGASFDFLFNVNSVSNDDQLFLNLTVSNYGYDRAALEPVLPRLRNVEVDLPVVLFLAKESGRPVDFIVGLRVRGLAWSAIFTELRLRPDVLFVGIDRDPGPPYGRAWGYWRKHPRELRLADADVAGLVQVQLGSRVAGRSAFELARARGRGQRVAFLVAEKHGRPYKAAKAGKDDRGQGRGHGPGKPHGHGHPL